MSGVISRWFGGVDALPDIAARLLRVQIENDEALSVIRRYDSEGTLFYCDPPYPHESRGDSNAYGFEMSDDEHRELGAVLHKVTGKVALSGYACSLLNDVYHDWHRTETPIAYCHSVKQPRVEVLWTNYHPRKEGQCLNQAQSSLQL